MERKRISSVLSLPGLVGGYFALRVCITFVFFQADPPTGAIISVALNLLLLLPVAAYAAGPAAMPLTQAFKVAPVRWVIGFISLAAISLLWSETPSIIVALGYWAAMASDVALVLLLVRVDGAEYAGESLLKGFVCGAGLLGVIAWAAPSMQDLRLGNDEFLSPNLIGFECALATILCQYLAAAQAERWKWLGIFLAITLVRSISKTSIAAFLIVEAIYLLRSRTIRRGTKIAMVTGAAFVAALFSGLYLSYYSVYTNAGTQAETLTGRTGIWLVTLQMAFEKPWLGHGFHSYRSVIPAFGAFEPWHAHNELLQQFFTYGVVGVLIVATLYWSLLLQCRRQTAHPLASTCRLLLLLVAIRGLVDTERFDLSFPLWAITAISLDLAWSASHQAREVAG
jgi:O-antigen ligase